MDYNENAADAAKVQMPRRAIGGISPSVAGQLTQPRTFDGIADATNRVRASHQQVEMMLDRISPNPPTDAKNAASTINVARPRYANSLEQLHAELNELGSALGRLEKHV